MGRAREGERRGEGERQEKKRVTLSFLFPSFRASYGRHPFPPPSPAPFFKYSAQEKQPLARVFAFRAKLLLRPVNSLPPFHPPCELGKKDDGGTKGRRGEKGRERGEQGTRWRRRRRRKSGGRKLARNSNFRSHFSSSINSYLYATPCFLSIRVCARALDFAGGVFPRDIAGICQSILRRTSERASELETPRNLLAASGN